MSLLTCDEKSELEALRRYKLEHEGKALTKAFARLDGLMASGHDPLVSVRAFHIIAECLVALRQQVES